MIKGIFSFSYNEKKGKTCVILKINGIRKTVILEEKQWHSLEKGRRAGRILCLPDDVRMRGLKGVK
jgi:hypothetical protein